MCGCHRYLHPFHYWKINNMKDNHKVLSYLSCIRTFVAFAMPPKDCNRIISASLPTRWCISNCLYGWVDLHEKVIDVNNQRGWSVQIQDLFAECQTHHFIQIWWCTGIITACVRITIVFQSAGLFSRHSDHFPGLVYTWEEFHAVGLTCALHTLVLCPLFAHFYLSGIP